MSLSDVILCAAQIFLLIIHTQTPNPMILVPSVLIALAAVSEKIKNKKTK